MNYNELKELNPLDAIRLIYEGEELDDNVIQKFPQYSDVIVFGGDFWMTNEKLVEFLKKYVKPKNERDIAKFLHEIAYRICSDPVLSSSEKSKNVLPDYKLMYKQHLSLFRDPDRLQDWSESKATFIWNEFILVEKRREQLAKIVKEQNDEALKKISAKIQSVYKFTDIEMVYLQYFCSQTKSDTLDSSLNTLLYFWSKEKKTGKTTVASYICSFLNGEKSKNVEAHKSKLRIEMQFDRFAIPKATISRCTLIDEGGFKDMRKSYNEFKEMITSNSCEIEYKYRSGFRGKRAWRNYIMTDNDDPIYFVQDESERRVIPIFFAMPDRVDWDELSEMWYNFVLECNFDYKKLEQIYNEIIQPNSQVGEVSNIMLELQDILSYSKIDKLIDKTYFSVSNIMVLDEIVKQKISRKVVKEVLVAMYGEPDSSQRFYKSNRLERDGFEFENNENNENEKNQLPF